jgi:hypothetical protein
VLLSRDTHAQTLGYMSTSAQPEALAGTAQPASLLRLLVALYFQPSRLFADLVPLKAKPLWIIVAWICGISSAIDRADTIMVRSELTGSESSSLPLDSWAAFWPFILMAGALNGVLVWLIGGWWYRIRLNWSGDANADQFSARIVFSYTNLITAMPALVATLVYTFVYESYRAAWTSDEAWSSLLIIFIAWDCIASYKGVRVAFTVSKWKARFWFLILPLGFYIAAAFLIGVIYAMQ